MSMTREEAIQILVRILENLKLYHDDNEVYNALDMAIEALKEQRPHGERVNIDDRPIGGFHED